MKKEILKNQAIREIVLCAENPIYFIENYCYIQHQVRGLVKFELYDFQKEAIKAFLVNDQVIINKARQLGFSTLTAAFITWLILFHNNKSVVIVSINAEVAKNLLKKIKIILSKLPDWMYLADFDVNRAHAISLTNGSSVKSIARSEDAGRSESLALLVVDEAAHIRGMAEMWKGLKSTLSTGGKAIALSTPRGSGENWFYKTYTEATTGENDWKPILVNWWECPDYASDLVNDPTAPGGKSSTWFRSMTKDMTRSAIAQELLTTFVDTGDTFFDTETIKHYMEATSEPTSKEGLDKNLWIWKQPEEGKKYLIGADAAVGNSADYSTAVVIDTKYDVVAEYKGQLFPDQFGLLLVNLAQKYNGAWICPENAGIGAVTCFTIKNQEYKNLVYLNKEYNQIDPWVAEHQGIQPGLPMNVVTRPMVVAKMEEFLRKNIVGVHSKRFVSEMNTFSVINGKPQAVKGSNDDLIMCMALAIWGAELIYDFKGVKHNTDALMLLDKISITREQFNFREETHRQKINSMKRKLEEEGGKMFMPTFMYRV